MTVVANHSPGDYQVTPRRVVRSEWTKLRSLRSTWILLAAAALLTVGLAAAFGYGYGQQINSGEVQPSTAEAVSAAFLGLDLFALLLGVFGVLRMTGEYGSGLIRASLVAVPRRLPVLWAKALVLVLVTAPVAVTVSVASFLISQAFAGDHGVGLGDSGVPRALLGAAAYPVAIGLLGLGIGAVLRHAAAAITVFVAALLVIPALLPAALSQRLQDIVLKYLPVVAGQTLYNLGDAGPTKLLAPGVAAIVLGGYVIVLLAGGAALLQRRDV
jgi:ABC-type transport system involved in multi-copper enzyme maturation permease subunit